MKNLTNLSVAIMLATSAIGFSATAQAVEAKRIDYASMMKMPMMDTNKDGMVSRQEYMDAMGKVYDMHHKEMKMKPQGMSVEEMEKFQQQLYIGGR